MLTTAQASALIKDEINNFLTSAGHNAGDSAAQLTRFMALIQPDIDEAIIEGDLAALAYIRDRIAINLARISFGLLYKEETGVQGIVISTLSAVIKIGTGVLLA